MTDAGDPESVTPGFNDVSSEGGSSIQVLMGHGSVVKYETPVPT